MSDDPVIDLLRAEGLRRYSRPMPRIETWADFIAWDLEERVHINRFQEKLRFARADEDVARMIRAAEVVRIEDDEVARLCEAEVFPT